MTTVFNKELHTSRREYTIAEGATPEDLIQQVRTLLSTGWMPLSGVVVVPVTDGFGYGYSNPVWSTSSMVSCSFLQTLVREI